MTPTPAGPTTPARNWRKLRPLLGLALAFGLLDCAVRWTAPVWERYSPDDYAARVEGCRREPRDFIVVGGSPVSEGFDPDAMTGLTWQGSPLANGYAVGLPGGTLTDVAIAVRHAAPIPPRLVIYGASATDVNDARNEPHGPYSLYATADVAEVWRTRPDARAWTVRRYAEGQCRRVSAIYRHRHGLKMAAADALESQSPGACPEAAKEANGLRDYADALRLGRGYAPAAWFADARYDLRKAASAPFAPFDFLDKYRTGSHWRYAAELHAWCTEHGVALVVVEMPVTADLEAKYPGPTAEFRALLDTLPADGVPVLRARREALNLGDADFADTIHLNRAGAAKLSAWTRDAVNALPRGDGAAR